MNLTKSTTLCILAAVGLVCAPGAAPRFTLPTAHAAPADPPPPPPTEPGRRAGDAREEPAQTPVGKHVKWVMDFLNGDTELDPAQLAERMAESYRKEVSPAELISTLRQQRDLSKVGGELEIEQQMDDGEHAAAVIVANKSRRFSIFIAVHDKDGSLTGLRIGPAGYVLDEEDGDWGGVDSTLKSLPGDVAFGAYELIPAKRQPPPASPDPAGDSKVPAAISYPPATEVYPIHQFGEEKRLAIGPTSKLFILGALAEETAAGRLKWSDKLAIRENLKSLPAGVMQSLPAGEERDLTTFVANMMKLSDNTAADHISAKLGRAKIDAYFTRFSADPARTLPFLFTMEAFKLKIGTPDLSGTYAGLDEAEQKNFLNEDGGRLRQVSIADGALKAWESPILIDRVEWFATPEELAQTVADLWRLERLPGNEPLRETMRQRSGVRLPRDVWPSVLFKGGAEPGVLNMTWLLERDDGRWYILSVGWNDAHQVLDEQKFIALARKGLDLLQKHESKNDLLPGPPEPPAPVPGEK